MTSQHLEHCTPDDPCQECLDKVCATCGGLGYISSPAIQRGGEIVDPDDHPCPDCSRKQDDNY